MKILITGCKGQLGYDLLREGKKRDMDCIGVDIEDMDITIKESVNAMFSKVQPDVLIHCAAWTAVDAAEDNVDKCRLINRDGTKNLAEACRDFNTKMIYISTDYVFNGKGQIPWDPDNSTIEPINTYGLTKYEGEKAVCGILNDYYIVRTSWVFGINGNNFVKTMLKLGTSRDEINVVSDQIGSPTYTPDLSVLLMDMALSDKYGVYHASNEGYCSWYDFTCEIMKQASAYSDIYSRVKINPILSKDYPSKAKRPFNSRLEKKKLDENGFGRLPVWQDALKRYLEELYK